MSIARKEARESRYWLRLSRSRFEAQSGPQSALRPLDCGPAGAICDLPRLLKESGLWQAEGMDYLVQEAIELIKILSTIIKNKKSKL
jgi:hypothetical protein